MNDAHDLTPLEALLLTRHLVAGARPPTPAAVRKDIGPLVEDRWAGSALTSMLERAELKLITLGHLARPEPPPAPPTRGKKVARPKALPVELTPAGRAAALRFLGVGELPPKATWAKVKASLLPARAMDLDAGALAGKGALKAMLLAKALGVEPGEAATMKQVLDLWTRRQFDIGPKAKLDVAAIQQALACRELGEHRPSDPKKAFDLLVSRQVGARKADDKELGDAILRRWAGGGHERGGPAGPSPDVASPEPPPPEPRIVHPPGDLSQFAARVKDAAMRCTTGRIGDNRVFICRVWDSLQADPEIQSMGLEAFKRRLAEANNRRLLDLTRADLGYAMDRDDVHRSEVHYLDSVFHFLWIGSERH
ncbi:hypothetical protein OJF2_66690 [Aquisphaera giovannonii]|uniref:Uncharacterized protein n=1 Tax=Aquisphaera giovannonii TaxID=406548 RepID=A0A5B9WDN2_9BACT|nr:hypothetical protein [Aquisphaera giovannonii]QEH38071.1 hypothetical protein OJF2_66690 [Aquisphaera giovannonii]